MERKQWIYLVVTILALGGGGYGACTVMTDGADEGLTAGDVDPGTADPGLDPPPYAADGGPSIEVDTPESEVADLPPTDQLEGVIAAPEVEAPEENIAVLPAAEVIEGVELNRRQEPCDGDPACEDERQRARDDRMTDDDPGPVR